MKLSPWFSGDVKPVHVGVYQRMWTAGEIEWTKWNGLFWSHSWEDYKDAEDDHYKGWWQLLKWRGIVK